MNRSEIDVALTWNLSTMFENQQAFDKQLSDAQVLLESLQQYEAHICDTKETYIAFMNKQEELERYIDNLVCYARMCTDVDPDDGQSQENLASAYLLYQKANVALTFVPLELIAHKEFVEAYLHDEYCKDYRYPMEEIFRTIPHRLSDEKEAMMASVDELASVPEKTFESIRLEHKPVHIDGKEAFLNDGTYQQFLLHKERAVRKEAFENYFSEYKKYQNVFVNLLSGHVKGQVFNAKIRNFPSALEASLFQDGADKALFDKVISMSNEKYISYVHEYFQARKDILKLDVQHYYDINLPLVESVDITYTIDDSFAILEKALAPLGNEYVSLLQKAREERWIDFIPHVGKRGGAYSGGSYDSNPFILTNYTGDYSCLSTLAHELGHSMHSYFSRRNNRAMLSKYKIFVAEVASTVNEVLVNKYLLDTCKDPQYKAYLLSNMLTQLVGTMYRQPVYAKFETGIHEIVERGESLSSSKVTQLYQNLNKAYYGEAVELDELQKFYCYHIPHFYMNFYVYKYTLGMAVALSFTKRILAGDVDDYLTFLTKGGSEAPIDELVHAGVDPRDDTVYDDAFTFFKETLDELKNIMLPK